MKQQNVMDIGDSFNLYRDNRYEICSQTFAEEHFNLQKQEYLELYNKTANDADKRTILKIVLAWDKHDKSFTIKQKTDYVEELIYDRSVGGYQRELRFKKWFEDEYGIKLKKTTKEFDKKYAVDYFNHEANCYIQVKPISNWYWKKKPNITDYDKYKVAKFKQDFGKKVAFIYEENDGTWHWEKELIENNK